MAGRKDFNLDQGATFEKTLTWSPGGLLSNLTGCTARMAIRATLDAATPIHTLTTENSGITLGGAAGTIALLIPAATSSAWTLTNLVGFPPRQEAVYDLEVILSDGKIKRLLEGVFNIGAEVTR